MRAVGIVGFKNSGKSTLTGLLAAALERRGLSVAVAKYSHSGLDKPESDSGRLRAPGRTVLALAEEECAVFYGEKRFLSELLPLVDQNTDILLVEGGKSLGFLPRILCLRPPAEQEPDELQKLHPSLALAAWGREAVPGLPFFPGGPDAKSDDAQIAALAALVEERAFLLPGLDCGACGCGDCAELAARVVAGEAKCEDCEAMKSELELAINGRILGMNPFTARIVAGALRGMLRELKGFAPGELELKMKV